MKRILLVAPVDISPVDQISPERGLHHCETVLELWRTGWYDAILVTGGKFLPSHIQTRPAADSVRDWLVSRGVSKRKILLENSSLDTFENVGLAIHILDRLKLVRPTITVVAHWQHALRFWVTFFCGYGRYVRLYPLMYSLSWQEFFREVRLFFYHLIDPRGVRAPAQKKRASRLFGNHGLQ